MCFLLNIYPEKIMVKLIMLLFFNICYTRFLGQKKTEVKSVFFHELFVCNGCFLDGWSLV